MDKLINNKLFKHKIKQKEIEFEILYKVKNKKEFNNIYNCIYLYDESKTYIYYEINIIKKDIRYRFIINNDKKIMKLEIVKKTTIIKKDISNFIRVKLSRENIIKKNTYSEIDFSIIEKEINNYTNLIIRKRINKYLPNTWRFDFAINIQKPESIKDFVFSPEKYFSGDNFTYQIEMELLNNNTKIKKILSSYNIINKLINLCIVGDEEQTKIFYILNNYAHILNLHFKKNPIYTFQDFSIRTVTLTKENIPNNLIKNYVYSIKFDGYLSLLFIHDDEIFTINSNNNISYKEKNSKLGKEFNTSLFISEKVGDIIYVFDCIVYNGESIEKKVLSERLLIVQKLTDFCSKDSNYCTRIKYSKRYDKTNKFKIYYKDIIKKIPQDGIIFTPKNEGYFESTTYKWKPIELQTIDFLVKTNNKELNLYVYDNVDNNYIPVLLIKETLLDISEFLPEDLNNKIVEFKYENKKWVPYKIRNDKLIANNINTAKSTIDNLNNPIKLDKLFSY